MIKPGVPKGYLLLVAGIVWSMAGFILLFRGMNFVLCYSNHKVIRLLVALIFGIGFYWLVFAKISLKHINRIEVIDIAKPCIFSFFNFRSYLLTAVMISMGITLRKLNLVNPHILYTFYIGMGIPLLISAFRFYYAFYKYKDVAN